MIDLDVALRASQPDSITWNEARALEVVEKISASASVSIDYEPPNEEWIRFADSRDIGMLSVRVPMALVTRGLSRHLSDSCPSVILVIIHGFVDEDLRASADLLEKTVLPYGWNYDFDTEAFSANDLFVESV